MTGPNETPRRTIRVTDEQWAAVTRLAAERQETVTEVVRRAFASYISERPTWK